MQAMRANLNAIVYSAYSSGLLKILERASQNSEQPGHGLAACMTIGGTNVGPGMQMRANVGKGRWRPAREAVNAVNMGGMGVIP